MASLSRRPCLELLPFVKRLWVSNGGASTATRERVLPTGAMHLALRLNDEPLRIYDADSSPVSRAISTAVIGGARASFYLRDISRQVRTVGVQLEPGAAHLLLGVPAGALADAHTSLSDVWGRESDEWRERLSNAPTDEARLELVEALLLRRLGANRTVSPLVSHALHRFGRGSAVAEVVADAGYSHRRFVQLFQEHVGLTPKVYCRLLRFDRALELLQDRGLTLTDVALHAGYSDQPHFHREFREFSGVAPGAYRALAPSASRHVPLR